MSSRTAVLSIGVLAHNEEHGIGQTLKSLFTQDVFGRYDCELVVVANGCADQTAEIARRCLADHRAVWSQRGSARVEDLSISGKANAWNEFVHRLSSPRAAVLVLMDADIGFLSPQTVSTLVDTLENSKDAVVCVDRPTKDIELQSHRTLFQRLLLSATPRIDPNDVPLCGQLYCASSHELRHLHLPPEIQVDDGFIRAMLLTHGFTRPEDRRRIVLAPGVSHSFTSVATLSELFQHERWIVAGSIINMLLFEHFHSEARPGRSASALIAEWGRRDPRWLERFIAGQVRVRGWRLVPGDWWTRRWSRLKRQALRRQLARLPTAAAGSAFDALVFLAATWDVRRGRGFRYWVSERPNVASTEP